DSRTGILPRRLFLSGAALARGRGTDLEMGAAARRCVERRARERRLVSRRVVVRCQLGVLLVRVRQHLGAHGLLYANPACRAAGASLVLALSLLVLTILQLRITRKDLESRAGRGDGQAGHDADGATGSWRLRLDRLVLVWISGARGVPDVRSRGVACAVVVQE